MSDFSPENLDALENCRRVELRTMAEVWRTITCLLQELASAGFDKRQLFGLRLSLEEALINAVKHGNHEEPGKRVCMTYHLTPQQFLARIEDEGTGFDIDQIPDPLAPENLERPGGRGVFLMHYYMTWVKYNDRGNCLTFCKKK